MTEELAVKLNNRSILSCGGTFSTRFKEGARWILDSLWHNQLEIPECGSWILLWSKNPKVEYYTYYSSEITGKWLYLEDLFSDEKNFDLNPYGPTIEP